MHSFIGTERGAHLKSLLSRAMHKSKGDVRIVGLSETIGDPELAKQWLIPRDPSLSRLSQIRLNKRISVI